MPPTVTLGASLAAAAPWPGSTDMGEASEASASAGSPSMAVHGGGGVGSGKGHER